MAVHYDSFTLIELVENRPCLWDKYQEVYKDKVEKQKAWREIFQLLEPDYKNMDKEEQAKIGASITAKWNNIRDAFMRSLKKNTGQSASKRYVYYEQLGFLVKMMQKDDSSTSFDAYEPAVSITEEDTDFFSTKESDNDDGHEPRPKKWRPREDIHRPILNTPNERKEVDPDEAFFLSVLPMVQPMSQEEKIDFRMNTLQFLKDIQRKRKSGSPAIGQYLSPPADFSNHSPKADLQNENDDVSTFGH